MKKKFAFLVACMLLVGALAGCGGAEKSTAPDKKTLVNIATGGTAGVYYPLGVAMAEIFNNRIPGMSAGVQSTGGSVANVNLLKDGKVQLAIIQNDVVYYAANGTEMFKGKKVPGLQGISTLYSETIQIVTLAGSNIKTVADLKGKRIAVGSLGSGTETNASQILDIFGLTYADVKPQYLSFNEAANGLKDGTVDAAFVTAGAPTAAIQDIAANHKVTLVGIPADKVDTLIRKYPFYAKETVKANTYSGMETDIQTVAVKAMLVTLDKVDEALIYKMTQALYSNLDLIKSAHAQGANVKSETAMEGMPITVHAGADKFFKGK